jgi:hypothetical protein
MNINKKSPKYAYGESLRETGDMGENCKFRTFLGAGVD